MKYKEKNVGTRLPLNLVKDMELIIAAKYLNYADFIRTAIREKIDRDLPSIISENGVESQ